MICVVEGCGKPGKGYARHCSNHWYRKRYYGDPLTRTRQDPNRIWVEDRLGFIELYDKSNQPKAIAIIDSKNVNLVSKHKWCLTSQGYVQATASNRGRTFTLHRLLMGFPNSGIDHRDGNPLNNRRSNLRLASDCENNRNRRSNNTYKGVYPSGSGMRPWIVRVFIDGRNVNVGLFADQVEAAHIYNDVATQLLGRRSRFLRRNGV